MRYSHGISFLRKKQHRTKIFKYFSLGLIIMIAAGFFVWLDGYMEASKTQTAATSNKKTQTYDSAYKNIKTDHFSFSAKKSWQLVASESSQRKFVYRDHSNGSLRQSFYVYIDQLPAQTQATRVLPVSLSADGRSLMPGEISGHCKQAVGDSRASFRPVTFEGVNFTCNAGSPLFTTFIGIRGGGTELRMTRANGQLASYRLVYEDVTGDPQALDIVEIIASFKAL